MADLAENVRGFPYRSAGANCRDTGGRFASRRSELERLLGFLDTTSDPGHWLFTGQRNAWGYGHFTDAQGRTVKAHRRAWELFTGRQIPAGLTLDHLCGRPACCRPRCLEPVTNSENLRRRHARRRLEEAAR